MSPIEPVINCNQLEGDIKMSEKPILFNTEMVRAILGGRKTCTRRLIKHNVDAVLNSPYHKKHPEVEDKQIISKLCLPPYQPGDILYTRETWAWCPCWDCMDDAVQGRCEYGEHRIYDEKKGHGCYMYRASCEDNEYPTADTWHPSIHMPKDAARIWLKVTEVRVERLHDMTIDDIRNEGLDSMAVHAGDMEIALEEWKILWNSTIKKSDLNRYGWDANPWVWVIAFEPCEKPRNQEN